MSSSLELIALPAFGFLSLGVQVCSLKTDTPQLIEPGCTYQILRFPFSEECTDAFAMHEEDQPDGYVVTDWATDDRSGLIWPSTSGWGHLYAVIQWEPASATGGYTELRDQFVRDPLGLTPCPNDTTATEHRAPTVGMQCFAKNWGCFVNPETPLALRVAHNDCSPRSLVLAEFKLSIHPAD
ncbi:hypothetical protein [Streptomyces chattanoogensis]|uniref:Uncharacterized protein n=1 Tax=Streptomyces chattanoogensis TaxID=66876 RepID=A0A0N0XSW5_9ACTN|nr:hypothetical protein [Streptomyces chattanoogensis]KPC59523.1 hypothetical protein ADL29_34365 [Streptomyces chattanoogensis]